MDLIIGPGRESNSISRRSCSKPFAVVDWLFTLYLFFEIGYVALYNEF